ncbi:hypothetical protein AX15_003749 [Amanita polypyramis BW_CC]|nr:hypothetical protein AX15_003749 [Amanita polypyramis BW_CC]
MSNALPGSWAAIQLPFLRSPIAEEVISGVKGNAPREVKEAPIRTLQYFHRRPGPSYYAPITEQLTVSEVSIAPSVGSAVKTDCTVFYKIKVGADMLGSDGTLSVGCVTLLIDETSGASTAAHSVLEGRLGLVGVSQSMNLAFHSTAKL